MKCSKKAAILEDLQKELLHVLLKDMAGKDTKQILLNSLFLLMVHVTIHHLNFINDTHELDKREIKSYLDAYNESGSKINNFIKYVENEWKQPLTRNS